MAPDSAPGAAMGTASTGDTPEPLHRLQPLLLASTEMTSGNPNQTCPAPTARSATPGRGCHRPPRPTFAVTVQEHLNSARDHQKVCTSTPNLSRHFVGSVPSDSHTLLLTRRAFSPQVFRQLPSLTPFFARRAAGSEPARRRAGRQGRATGLRAWCKHRLPVGAVCYARCGWDISVLQGRDR